LQQQADYFGLMPKSVKQDSQRFAAVIGPGAGGNFSAKSGRRLLRFALQAQEAFEVVI
jgi:hypothetical protein